MDKLFKEIARPIKIYLATETVNDPYEKDVTETFLNPLPIKAIITDLTTTKAQYAMAGIITDKAKEIIIEKKYESLLLKSRKIEVDNDYYIGWKRNGRLQYRNEGNFIRAYIYIEKS